MNMSTYLRGQAELCIALSRATIDLTVASRLRAMAADLRAKACECAEELSVLSHDAVRSDPAHTKASRS
jgi:hypothetical protein